MIRRLVSLLNHHSEVHWRFTRSMCLRFCKGMETGQIRYVKRSRHSRKQILWYPNQFDWCPSRKYTVINDACKKKNKTREQLRGRFGSIHHRLVESAFFLYSETSGITHGVFVYYSDVLPNLITCLSLMQQLAMPLTQLASSGFIWEEWNGGTFGSCSEKNGGIPSVMVDPLPRC